MRPPRRAGVIPSPAASWNAFDAASGLLKPREDAAASMRPILALALLLLLPVAAAKADYVLEAHDNHASLERALGRGGHFRLAGQAEANPTLEARAGEPLTLVFRNLGGTVHDLAFGAPVDARVPCCVPPDGERTLTVDVPADAPAEVEYVCTLHAGAGMKGMLRIASAAPAEPVSTQEIPAGGALLAGLAVACAAALQSASRRRGVA